MSGLHHACARFEAALDHLQPVAALLVRLYLFRVFFLSGLTKLRDWDTTVLLFTEEYHVPLLPPGLAALAGTATEIVLPVLLVLGLCGRGAACVLFVFNIIAVISYPALEAIEIKDHVLWGVLLAMLCVYGCGKFSLDRWLWLKHSK